MDDAVIASGVAYSASLVVSPYTAARSFALLWNPSDSGIVMHLDRVVLNHAGPGADGFDFRKATAKVGTLRNKGVNKNFAIAAASPCELYYGNAPMANLAPDANIIHEAWMETAWREREYLLEARCPPCTGVMICAANDARYLIATFHYRIESLVQ